MPPFTKKAIVESFLRLACKKPLDKITVRDIVDDCGINRNTFYYYFQDIYAVLEDICRTELDQIPTDAPLASTMCAAFRALAELALQHEKAIRHITIAVGREGVERYFGTELDSAFYACLVRTHPTAPHLFLRHTAAFLRHAFLGVYMDWLRAKDRADAASVCEELTRWCAAFTAANF